MNNGSVKWHNETRRLSQLIPWDVNPRQLTEKQAKHLETSLRKFGYADPINISADNEIYDGHQRRALMYIMNEYGHDVEIDVRVSSRKLTDDERREFVVRKHENTGDWDWDSLGNRYDVEELGDWGMAEWKIDEFFPQEEPDQQDAPPQIDRAEELRDKWGVETGQLWRLPSRAEGQEHRLICGDCTDKAVVERVMDNQLCALVLTDPPYGVDYVGGTTEREKLSGDNSPDLYEPALKIIHKYSEDKAPLYLWHSDSKSAAVSAAVSAAGYERRCTIIWNKNQAQFGALSAQYKTKHEPCYYLYKRGETPYWYGPTNEVTVWDGERASINNYHPTQKPTYLSERIIKNSSKVGDVVADFFLGSGSTLIACENLSRQCRAVEIAPAYVAVALQRYVDAFGIEPELIS